MLHFSLAEFSHRIDRVCKRMAEENFAGMLLFSQESMYYLTGYDTFGYCFFQCMLIKADGQTVLLTRAPDLRQAKHTSTVNDIRIWRDAAGADPTIDLAALIKEVGGINQRFGVEFRSYGLNAADGFKLLNACKGVCELVDASELVSALRSVKSPAEIAYVKQAAVLADQALAAAVDEIRPGAAEGTILAALQGAVYQGGGESPGNETIIGSGADALLCRSKAGRRCLDPVDQLTLEFAGVYRRYHAAMMRTVCIGKAGDEHRRMYDVCLEALTACRKQLMPSKCMGDVFAAYADTCDRKGFREHRLNATGYSLGSTFAPTWMDYPMFYEHNPHIIQPNMVLFVHIILMNSITQTAMTLGETYLTTDDKPLRLSAYPLDLLVKNG